MNNYTKIKIKISPVASSDATGDMLSWDDAADILSSFFANIGFETFEQEKPYLTSYIPSRIYDRDIILELLSQFPYKQDFILEVKETEEIEGRDWNSEWEKNYFQPYVFGENKCVVHSSFHTGYPQCEYDIVIDPKMAFGTGHHSTTRLMVEALFDSQIENKTLLDVGTGSAILAILASKLKARRVMAVEIDEAAYDNALENIKLNGCTNIEVVHGDIYHLQDGLRFNIVLANINRNIILDDLPEYCRRLNPEGLLLVSGFYNTDAEMIDRRAAQCRLEPFYRKEDKDWIILGYRKPPVDYNFN